MALIDKFGLLLFILQEIEDKVKQFSLDAVHIDAQACVVCILSHGMYGQRRDQHGKLISIGDFIFGTDGELVSLSKLMNYFNNRQCPALQGKPKLFFVQACRGGK